MGDGRQQGPTLDAGAMLGQYRVVRLLGRGGMGEVYEVEHEILQTRHALKLLPAERSAQTGFVSRFRDEARVMAQLKHPGICHVTHADVSEGHHYLIMDLIAASENNPYDLEEALADAEEGRLAPEIVARLGVQIAEAVGYAHTRGVVHRDLKPSNILLTSRDLTKADVRVADFGLARLVGEEWMRSVVERSMRQSMSIGGMPTMAQARSERSTTGSILGTYDYMSPEQREGKDADERSDIFAMGVMLYRMVTGKRLMGLAKPAGKVVKGLSAEWDRLLAACLEDEPAERPSSCEHVGTALLRLVRCSETTTKEGDDIHSGTPVEGKRFQDFDTVCDSNPLSGRPRLPADLRDLGEASFAPLGGLASGSAEAQSAQKSAVSETGLPLEVKSAKTGIALRLIPAGRFTMGSPSGESERDDDEREHSVTLTQPFYCGKYEVTQAEWERVMGSNPSHFTSSGADAPVEEVSWEDCQRFLRKLCAREGVPPGTYRLLTEAEWEYACRAGTQTPFCYGERLDSRMANFNGDYPYGGASTGIDRHKTIAVGQFKPNAYGLYDMHGNVWEWCSDWYEAEYSSRSVADPVGPSSGSSRVDRGGSWSSDARNCRSASRGRVTPSRRGWFLGFRLARTAPNAR